MGKIHLHLESAERAHVDEASSGNHYVVVSIDDSEQEELRTHTVYSSSAPIFNKSWILTAPHYRCSLRLDLFDADIDRRIGTCATSLYALMMRDADFYNGEWRAVGTEKIDFRCDSLLLFLSLPYGAHIPPPIPAPYILPHPSIFYPFLYYSSLLLPN